MRSEALLRATFSALLITSFSASWTKAQPLEFYQGKTVTLVVGGSAGGGYDALARAIARFLGRRVPGNPTVVVRNMPGAGGMIATNYLYSNAEPDGTVVGLVENSTPLAPLFGAREVRYDPTRFGWLGTPSIEVALVLLWHTVSVNSVDDLKDHVTTMGASGVNSTQAFYSRFLNSTLGTKMKVINGYAGLNDSFLAMERGEIDGSPSVFYSALTSTRPAWLSDHSAKAIVQYGPVRLSELPSVPFASDLVTNPDDKLLMEAAFAPLALGRPMAMPPGVPAGRLATMRNALAEVFGDPQFKAAADKSGLIVNAPQTGEQLQEVINRAYGSPPRIVDRLRQLANPKE